MLALLCFFIAKSLGRNAVDKLTSKTALKNADDFLIIFWSFFIATGIGQLPATIIYSYIGGMLTGTAKTSIMVCLYYLK